MRKADNLPPYCAVVKNSRSLNFLDPRGLHGLLRECFTFTLPICREDGKYPPNWGNFKKISWTAFKKRTNCCSDGRLLCCVIPYKLTRTFRRNMLPPSSGFKELYPSRYLKCSGDVVGLWFGQAAMSGMSVSRCSTKTYDKPKTMIWTICAMTTWKLGITFFLLCYNFDSLS